MPWPAKTQPNAEPLLTREWLVTNGLGGYASGTVAGVHHAPLSTATHRRAARAARPHDDVQPSARELALPERQRVHSAARTRRRRRPQLHGADFLSEFRLDMGLPVWRYEVDGITLEKRLLMPHGQNTVHVNYRIAQRRRTVRLELRPSVHFRPHDAPVSEHCRRPTR